MLAQPQSSPDDAEAMNAKAHALLDRAVGVNGLTLQGAQPWHVKADFQWQGHNGPIESGTLEEWWKGPDEWRRTYTMKKVTWTEWSVDHIHQFESPGQPLSKNFANLRIATPLITPLFQAKNFLPEYPMQIAPMEAGVHVNCISVVDPVRYVGQIDPDFLFPKYCLDALGVLRGVVTSDTLVTFDNFTVFDKRAVAKNVVVFVNQQKVSESKITLLTPLGPEEEPLLKPDRDAIPQPFAPMASDPRPVLIHSEKPMVPANMVIAGGGGPVSVHVIIGKDGKVRPTGPISGTTEASPGIINAAVDAASRFRYEPYMIDGQPVEVSWNIGFSYGHNGYIAQPPEEDDKPTGYDPKRDPAADLKTAEAAAQQGHKHILLEVGGNWCIWCGYLDHFFAAHPDVDAYLKANFVLVKVNWSAENHNNTFVTQFAEIPSFPFLIVLDENGKLLQAQKTGELEQGHSYDPNKMMDFLGKWKPGAQTQTAAATH
jgi:Thioredoxin-like